MKVNGQMRRMEKVKGNKLLGVLECINGDKYNGDWKDGKKDGKGEFEDSNGNKYNGDWKDDAKNGKGIFK